MAALQDGDLPDSNSSDLVLQHPTTDECLAIWNTTVASWCDSLTIPLYLKESLFLTTIPLARNGGMTSWVLVHKDLPPGKRPILCSCESFRKLSLTSDPSGNVKDNIVHGIASVFCPVPYRRRGYARRMMQELANELHTLQTDRLPCVGSTLYSDIGKEYYFKLGWLPNTKNSQVEFQPKTGLWPASAKTVLESDLEELCNRDEAIIRSQMATPTSDFGARFTIIPDLAHMGWHIGKEDFATNYLFGKSPTAKGVKAGPPGSQLWATWTHRYYGRPDETANNVLYILRLVMERDETATRLPSDSTKKPPKDVYEEQARHLKTILQAAQAEAAEWKLDVVKLWDPTPLVLDLLSQSGLEYTVTERQEDSIASLLWYDCEGGMDKTPPLWVNNEHYAWQ